MPVGATVRHGMPNDRFYTEQMDARLESLYREIRLVKESGGYRINDYRDFPAIVHPAPTMTTIGQGRPLAPSSWWQQGFQQAAIFNPSRPPPPLPQRPRQSDRAPVAVGRPAAVERSRLPRQEYVGTSVPSTSGPSDFERLVGKLFRFGQLSHHRRNWASLPRSLNGRVSEFVKDITPPLTNEALRQSLADAANDFRGAIRTKVLKHLDDQLALVSEQLKASRAHDVRRASREATTRLQQRLQRFDHRRSKEDAAKAISLTGKNFEPLIVVVDSRPTTSTNVSNNERVDAVLLEGSRDTMEGIEPIMLSPRRPSPNSNTNIILTTNRFDALSQTKTVVTRADTKRAQVIISPLDEDTVDKYLGHPSRNSKVIINVKPKVSFEEEEEEELCCGGKLIAENKHNLNLVLAEDTKILIIGDSNLRKVDERELEQDWQIWCIPGANLDLTTKIINAIPLQHKLTDIIITSGICDLNNRRPPISNCLCAIDRLGVRKHFVGVSFDGRKLSAPQISNLNFINDFAEADLSTHFISPLRSASMDIDGIHYLLDSVKTITAKIKKHIRAFLGTDLSGPIT
jgi:hypothetical protein